MTKKETSAQERLLSGELVTDPKSAKGKLLKEARLLFKKKGYEKTTVRDIAAATGILSGSIFYHFSNKEDILRCVMEETICITLTRLQQEFAKARSLEEQIKTLIRCELDAIYSRQGHDFTILVTEWRSLNKDNQNKVLQYREAYEALWINTLDTAQQQGMSPLGGIILRGFIRGALVDTINWYKADGKLSLEELKEQVYRAFFIRPVHETK